MLSFPDDSFVNEFQYEPSPSSISQTDDLNVSLRNFN